MIYLSNFMKICLMGAVHRHSLIFEQCLGNNIDLQSNIVAIIST